MEMAAMGKQEREKVLLFAASEGNLRLLKKMARGLDSGGQDEAAVLAAVTDGEGNRALHLAAAAGRVEVCRYIVEDLRLDVNQPNFKGETPLFYSAFYGGAAAARYLIDHGADPLAGKIWSPLHGAAAKGNFEIVELLLSRGINVDLHSVQGTPLHAAALHKQDCMMKFLLEHHADAGADVNFVDFSGITNLILAVQYGLPGTVQCLLDAGANPNIPDEFGRTPIEFAASEGRRDMVEMLFPLTSPIPTLPEWSIDGIISHVESFGLKPRDKQKCEKRRTGLKQKAKEAFQREQYFIASQFYSCVMAFDPSPDDRVTILANLSLCSLRGGNGSGALSYATMCRMARPHWPKACYRQGAAFMLQKDYEKACEAFADGLKLDPKSAEIANALREAREAAKNAC
nr:uncharacterized protein LOC127314051 isoform X15 [Lolium perenne]XP_051200491.1 uncharacterized protein LOC127314051 isoform X16 [Lolium perenne]